MSMNRRGFLASLASPLMAQAPRERPWNFVFVLADDLGWSDTTPYDADLHETPNLDRLARLGVKFTRAYAAAPVCSPTRASIHTGKYPAKLHITIWREAARRPPANQRLIPPVVEENLPHTEVTIAELLRDQGYFTAHVGKWHLGNAEHYPETHGFDVNIGGTVWGAPATFFWPYRGLFGSGEYRYVPGLHGGQPGEYLTDRLTDEALKLIDAAGERPFFLNLCYHTVHTPIEGKAELVERYRAKLRPGLRHQNAAYAAMVHSLDENVGRVLERLERNGLADRTVVIFTSDNGGYINPYRGQVVTNNHPLRSGKGSLYEGGIRVPLIIRWPGVAPAGKVSGEPVCSIDFYPTILEMAGLSGDARHNAAVDGRSLAPLLKDPAARLGREELFFHYPHYYATTSPVSAVLAREWKLLEYFEDGRLELYRLGRDPGETRNLASEEPVVARRLHERLRAWRAAVNAQTPSPNPDWRGK
jgi:arylsulfatase A-like enzyme